MQGLQLGVPDIEATHAELTARGLAVSDVQVMGENPGPGSPLGNSWAVQQISYPRDGGADLDSSRRAH